ncbi:MAG: SNF2-related protein [Magnetococcus sp. YQC-5]
MTAAFEYAINTDGILFQLMAKRLLGQRKIPFAQWSNEAPARSMAAIGTVTRWLTEQEGNPEASVRLQDDKTLFLSHSNVAGLSEYQAMGLGLPPSTLFILCVQSKGDIAQKEFEISCQWTESHSVKTPGVEIQGSIMRHKKMYSRIPEPLYSIHAAIVAFRACDTTDDETRFKHLAALKEILPEQRQGLDVDPYIKNTIITVASAFSLKFSTGKEGFDLDPVLFGHKMRAVWGESDGEAVISESEALLPEAYQKRFTEHFRAWSDCKDRYALGSRHYVYVEPGLRQVLNEIRQIQRSDAQARRAFARQPQAVLKARLENRLEEAAIEQMFIATEEYSKRVVDMAIWQTTVLPWIKRLPNSWLPESFGIMVGDIRITIKPEEVAETLAQYDAAEARGDQTVELAGHTIPVSNETKTALQPLTGLARLNTPESPEMNEKEATCPEQSPEEAPQPTGKLFLTIEENFETMAFAPPPLSGRPCRFEIPTSLLTRFKPHQEAGLHWLEECWSSGYPGCLLADDMGLGKSLQALTFLVWLKENRRNHQLEHRPMLVVAPVGLLRNWSDERRVHLAEDALGECLSLYGQNIARFKQEKSKGVDTDQGIPRLQTTRMAEADWILTSYDTLRDYHFSFAKVKFSVIIYDEVQKLKNPTSQWSRSAKTMNTEFSIGMTGTPIENRIEDLWAIMDVVYPGYLPDLKTFSKRYDTDQLDVLRELRQTMLDRRSFPADQQQPDKPAVMLRRMKADQLKGLPEKQEYPVQRVMPPQQAKAYHEAVVTGRKASTSGDMLRTIHHLRGISLHPTDPKQASHYQETYVSWSARLSVTFELLREIAKKQEKALVFLEDRDMQDMLAPMLKREFKLEAQPFLIHGGIPGDRRKDFVDQFQDKRRRGQFDVMILSPKAGGVGLTLTAANHVIHLSRWWNPAVEDQCTDRVYRIGQEQTVHVHYPLAVHPDPEIKDYSFDLQLSHLLERKRRLSREVLTAPLSPSDETELFKKTINTVIRPEQSNPGQEDALLLADVDRMSPQQFENWVLSGFAGKGWRVNRTPATRDGGTDGILTDPQGRRALVQIKHRSGDGKCDDTPVDDLIRARKNDGMPTDLLFAVTNSIGYTVTAMERAQRHNIVMIARKDLLEWVGHAV